MVEIHYSVNDYRLFLPILVSFLERNRQSPAKELVDILCRYVGVERAMKLASETGCDLKIFSFFAGSKPVS